MIYKMRRGQTYLEPSGSIPPKELVMKNGCRIKFVQSKEKQIVGGNIHGFYIGRLDPDATIEVPVEE